MRTVVDLQDARCGRRQKCGNNDEQRAPSEFRRLLARRIVMAEREKDGNKAHQRARHADADDRVVVNERADAAAQGAQHERHGQPSASQYPFECGAGEDQCGDVADQMRKIAMQKRRGENSPPFAFVKHEIGADGAKCHAVPEADADIRQRIHAQTQLKDKYREEESRKSEREVRPCDGFGGDGRHNGGGLFGGRGAQVFGRRRMPAERRSCAECRAYRHGLGLGRLQPPSMTIGSLKRI